MRPVRWNDPVSCLKALVAIAALGHGLLVLAIVAQRIAHPFELEWMEGGSLVQVQRILQGLPLYVPPSVDFVPYIYAPLYFYVSAVPAAVLGFGFLPLRLTAFLCSLGVGALVFALVRRETRSNWAGLAAVGLFAASYPLTGTWFDIARVDTLFLLLVMAAAYGLRWAAGWRGLAVAGLLAGLACLTKQQGLPIVAVMLAFGGLFRRRQAVAFALPAVLVPALGYAMLHWLHGGWSSFYLFDLPRRHYLQRKMLGVFFVRDLLVPMGAACALVAAWALQRVRREQLEATAFYALMLMALGGTSLLSRLNVGAAANVLLPMYAWLAVLFGLALHAAAGACEGRMRPWALGALALALFQLSWLAYRPAPWIPTPADRAAGWALVAQLKAVKGAVWVPSHPYLAVLAGKPEAAHEMAVEEILIADPASKARMIAEIETALAERRFAVLVLDRAWSFYGQIKALPRLYGPVARQVLPDGALVPVTGYRTRPTLWYEPKATEAGP